MRCVSFFKNIADFLRSGENLVLATILQRSGSAPRAVGSRMAVRSDGSILGTIGGGFLEARVVELAGEVFKSRSCLVRDFTLTAEDASHMGMICGGQVQVLIHFVDASEDDESQLYAELGRIQERHGRGWLITRLPQRGGTGERPENGLLGRDGAHTGNLNPVLGREAVAQFKGRQPDVVWRGEQGFLVEPLSTGGSVVIFGAGHVSLELAALTGRVGFRTVVVDDREEFANRCRFPSAEEIRVIESFDRAMDGLEINEESYLVLVTRGHAHDRTVLAQALRTGAGYIGMIGSRRKRDAIYEALLGEGFNRRDLERVHCPVGLDIGAETPEEIAVSILAELIQVRAQKP